MKRTRWITVGGTLFSALAAWPLWAQEPSGDPAPGDREQRRERREAGGGGRQRGEGPGGPRMEGPAGAKPADRGGPRSEGPAMAAPERMERWFKALDANADGKIDMDEFLHRLPDMLKKLHAEGRGPGMGAMGPREEGPGKASRRVDPGGFLQPGSPSPGGKIGGDEPRRSPLEDLKRRLDERIDQRVKELLEKHLPRIERQMQSEREPMGPPMGKPEFADRMRRGRADGPGAFCPLGMGRPGSDRPAWGPRDAGRDRGGPQAFQPPGRFEGRGDKWEYRLRRRDGSCGEGPRPGADRSWAPPRRPALRMLDSDADGRLEPQEIRQRIEMLERLLRESERKPLDAR